MQITMVVAFLVAVALRNAFSELTDYARFGDTLATWEPFVWEFSSLLFVGALIPAVAWLNRRFPVATRHWYRTVPIHLAATLPFSIVHVSGMVALRKLAYELAGDGYHFGPILSGWIYEYRKDFVAYWVIIAGLYAFRTWRQWRRAQNRAEPVEAGDPARTGEPAARPDRLAVRKLNREFILNANDIARVEADGNYVTVYARGTTYRLRTSLAGLAKRLDERRFVQIHRSQIVNIDHIREIQPWDHGDYRVVLKDGSFINFSRRYRARLDGLLDPPVTSRVESPARP